jgi:hypothetical protein
MSPQAAAFARDVIGKLAPGGRERAKNLLWAAGRLADYGIGLGLDPAPEVLLHPSMIERFTAHARACQVVCVNGIGRLVMTRWVAVRGR